MDICDALASKLRNGGREAAGSLTFLWAMCVSGLDSLNGSRLAPFRRVSKQSERALNAIEQRGRWGPPERKKNEEGGKKEREAAFKRARARRHQSSR